MTNDDTILRTVTPVTHDLGDFKVHRSLPAKSLAMVGPFVFVDQFGPAQFDLGAGMDVRPHPHIGLATVTYLFEGAIDHRDSVGTVRTIEPGAVNLMTAGSGVVHSERSPAGERSRADGSHGGRIAGMQTWLALPDGKEELAPGFEHRAEADLPLVDDGRASARLILGAGWGAASPVTQHGPTLYAHLELAAGATLPIGTEAEERALVLVSGEATVDGAGLEPFALYLLAPDRPMTLRAGADARMILLGGQAFDRPRHVWWNFVSSSRERIEQAKADWRARRFPEVPGDGEEFIPLPKGEPKTVSYP